MCITDTKGSHADLTDDYAAIRREMESVAEQLGKKVLREVDEDAFYAAIPAAAQGRGRPCCGACHPLLQRLPPRRRTVRCRARTTIWMPS